MKTLMGKKQQGSARVTCGSRGRGRKERPGPRKAPTAPARPQGRLRKHLGLIICVTVALTGVVGLSHLAANQEPERVGLDRLGEHIGEEVYASGMLVRSQAAVDGAWEGLLAGDGRLVPLEVEDASDAPPLFSVVEVRGQVEGWEKYPRLRAMSGKELRVTGEAGVPDWNATIEGPLPWELATVGGIVVSTGERFGLVSVLLSDDEGSVEFHIEEPGYVCGALLQPGTALTVTALAVPDDDTTSDGGQTGGEEVAGVPVNTSLMVYDSDAIHRLGRLIPPAMALGDLCRGLGDGAQGLTYPVSVMAVLGAEPSPLDGGGYRYRLTDGLPSGGCSMVAYGPGTSEGGGAGGALHMGDVVNVTGTVVYRSSSSSYRMDIWSVSLVERGGELRVAVAALAEDPYAFQGATVNVTGYLLPVEPDGAGGERVLSENVGAPSAHWVTVVLPSAWEACPAPEAGSPCWVRGVLVFDGQGARYVLEVEGSGSAV